MDGRGRRLSASRYGITGFALAFVVAFRDDLAPSDEGRRARGSRSRRTWRWRAGRARRSLRSRDPRHRGRRIRAVPRARVPAGCPIARAPPSAAPRQRLVATSGACFRSRRRCGCEAAAAGSTRARAAPRKGLTETWLSPADAPGGVAREPARRTRRCRRPGSPRSWDRGRPPRRATRARPPSFGVRWVEWMKHQRESTSTIPSTHSNGVTACVARHSDTSRNCSERCMWIGIVGSSSFAALITSVSSIASSARTECGAIPTRTSGVPIAGACARGR
jgi:hypothetical protein